MALTATFVADFESFYRAVDQATLKLTGFEQDALSVGEALSKSVDKFSGRQVIEEAALMSEAVERIGGVSQLTASELHNVGDTAAEAVEKMQALGMDVPERLQSIADAAQPAASWLDQLTGSFTQTVAAFFTGQAAFGLAEKALSFFMDSVKGAVALGGQLQDLAAATRIDVEVLQELGFAGQRVGLSMEDTAAMVGRLAQRIASGDTSMVAAVQSLGLSYQDLQQQTPDEQFIAIAEAVSSIVDPLAQARLGTDLFGKQFSQVMKLASTGIRDTMDSAKGLGAVLDADATQKLDKFGDKLGDLGARTKILVASALTPLIEKMSTFLDLVTKLPGGSSGSKQGQFIDPKTQDEVQKYGVAIGSAAGALKEYSNGLKLVITDTGNLDMANADWLDSVALANNRLNALRKDAMAPLSAMQKQQIREFSDYKLGLEEIARLAGTNVLAVQRYQESLQKQAEATKKTADETRKATEAQQKFLDAVRVTTSSSIGAKDSIGAIGIMMQATTGRTTELTNVLDGLNENGTLISITYKNVAGTLQDMGQAGAKGFDAIAAGMAQTKDLGAMLQDNLKGIPDILISAFTGGGGLEGAVKALAVDLGKTFATNLAAGIKANKDAGTSVLNADNLKSAGAGAALAGAGTIAAGGSLGQGIGSAVTAGASVAVMGGLTSASIALGAATMGIGTAAVFAAWGIKKLLSDPEKKINPIREQFVQAAGGLDQLNERAYAAGMTLDQLLSAKTKEQYEAAITALNDGFEAQQSTMALLVETAQKYGFTIEELGPAMQRQNLDQQAQQLYQDFNVLNSAGIDSVAITTRMSDSVNAYVHDALQMGVEVPMAMKPMLEAMVRAGQLTDANGVKMESLEDSGLSFSMTMSEGFKALITSVDQLATVISRSLGTAISDTTYNLNRIPRNIPVNITYTETNRPTSGGNVELEGYDEGTDGFRNFGTGTPVMLHGWEAVVPRDKASSDGATLGGAGGGGGTTIVINAQGAFFDTPGDLQRLADRVNEALTAKYGLKNTMRAA